MESSSQEKLDRHLEDFLHPPAESSIAQVVEREYGPKHRVAVAFSTMLIGRRAQHPVRLQNQMMGDQAVPGVPLEVISYDIQVGKTRTFGDEQRTTALN